MTKNNNCPYSGECQLQNCLPEESCFIKQLFEERNEAERNCLYVLNRADERLREIENIIRVAITWGLDEFKVIFDLAAENVRYVAGYPRKYQPEDLDKEIGKLVKVLTGKRQ